MKDKNKKPLSGGTGSGKSENQQGVVFCPQYSITPKYTQTDYSKVRDVLMLEAEVLRLSAQIADLEWQRATTMRLIEMGGTIYPLTGARYEYS